MNNRDEGFRLVEPQGEKLFTLLRGGRNPGIKQDEIMSVGWKWSIIAFMEPWFMMLIVRVSGKGNIKLNGQLRFQKQGNTSIFL